MTDRIKGIALVIVSLLLVVFGWGFAQSSQHEQHHGNQAQQQGMIHGEGQGRMMEQCPMMKDQPQKMMSAMKANDEELKSLVEMMKATDDEGQKVEVMENLLVKLVEARTQMHEQMMGKMMPQMMQQMSQHLQQAQAGDAPMMDCPMMRGHSEHSEGSGTMLDQDHQH